MRRTKVQMAFPPVDDVEMCWIHQIYMCDRPPSVPGLEQRAQLHWEEHKWANLCFPLKFMKQFPSL